MKKIIAMAALSLSLTSVFASGYGGYDQEPVDVYPVKITVKGNAAATCQESKATVSGNVSISGCDYTDVAAECKCEEAGNTFSCVYSSTTTCTPEYELHY